MKKLAIVLIPILVLTLIFGVFGCGGEAAPTPSPTPIPTEPPPTPPPTPTPTAVPPTATPLATPPPPDLEASGPPCAFRGTVKLNGADVPNGTIVTAIIEGYGYNTVTPAQGYGTSTFRIVIPKAQGVDYSGKTVRFRIGTYDAAQTATWSTGGNVLINLTATTQ